MLFRVRKGEAELEVKSLTLNKPPYKSLASKQTYNTYKILVSPSLRDRVKCGVSDGKGDINSLATRDYVHSIFEIWSTPDLDFYLAKF